MLQPQASLWSRNREIGVQRGGNQLESPRRDPVFSEDRFMIHELTGENYWWICALKSPFDAVSVAVPSNNRSKADAHWVAAFLTAESSRLCNTRNISRPIMSPGPKIVDEVCVLAVAEPRRQVEHAPVWIDMRITRIGKKDTINKQIPADLFLPDGMTWLYNF